MERQFNNAAGFGRNDDMLPSRVMEEPARGGTGDGEVVELEKILDEYYGLRGWDNQGIPKPETLSRLRLKEIED